MDYGIYIGKIVSPATILDARVQVRILPQMDDSAIEDSMCPRWSCFFRDQIITGTKGEFVWVICDIDFNNGYILGMANYTTYKEESFSSGLVNTSDKETTNFSIPETLKNTISDSYVELKGEIFNLNNIRVDYWNDTSIHFVERSEGGKVIAYSNGSIFVMRPSEFYVKIGNNTIRINSDDISMNGEKILLQSNDIGLGNDPMGKALYSLSDNDSSIAGSSTSVRV